MEKKARKLTSQARNNLPKGDFVFPAERRYPIHDRNHARAALRFSAGKPEESKVRSAVYARYPEMKPGHLKAATVSFLDDLLKEACMVEEDFKYEP